MTLAAFLSILGGIFKFWDQVTWLVKTLQSTPEEKHNALVTSLQKEADNYAQTGRPTWSS